MVARVGRILPLWTEKDRDEIGPVDGGGSGRPRGTAARPVPRNRPDVDVDASRRILVVSTLHSHLASYQLGDLRAETN